jgi:hypothetical protein
LHPEPLHGPLPLRQRVRANGHLHNGKPRVVVRLPTRYDRVNRLREGTSWGLKTVLIAIS